MVDMTIMKLARGIVHVGVVDFISNCGNAVCIPAAAAIINWLGN